MRREWYWIREEIDKETGDILDVMHFDNRPEVTPEYAVALVCDDDNAGRSWAYVSTNDGEVPTYTLDTCGNQAYKVPSRFR